MECIIVEYLLAENFKGLLDNSNFIPIVAIVMGCSVGIIAIIFGSIASVYKARAHEETKRELAAYVAEGTIEPDKAIALLQAGESACEITGDGIKVT